MSLVESQKGMTDLIPCNEQCGGDYDTYSFGQGDTEVIVTIPLPEKTTSKMISVEITTSTLTVSIKGKPPIISGELYKPVKASECTWCIEDKRILVITLVKTNFQYEEWWPCVTVGERQIDMKTFKPPIKHVSELDESAQATIAKMMFDQRQKMQNLPTSDELQLEEIMRRARGPS
ncbi:nuclear movement protein [Trypanosoma grayi]|uniref:nuclear movement protein n=1 Tax=Trypanosoma grayi TaxID=71804 RepID=UPI0004F4B4A7|nr:nuclear movement protein [Trypanosoma grayi]KEG09703.1 nuclear movement protein [Trypanosoma grayi]